MERPQRLERLGPMNEISLEVIGREHLAEAPDMRPPPKKRRRIVISCTECHRRKQKCDRELPCANCKSRNKETSCRYDIGAPTAKVQGKTSVGSRGIGIGTGISTGTGTGIGSGVSLSPPPPPPSIGMGMGVSAGPGANIGRHNGGPTLPPLQSISAAATNWGYAQSGQSTLGFLKKIERANGGDGGLSATATAGLIEEDQLTTKDRYKSLIRQLPAKSYIERLIRVYFREFNYNYYPLDEDVFLKQLSEWNNLSFKILSSSGPKGLSPDLRVFPALLFQVIGTALMILTDEPHEFYDHLKYAGNMTFEDLASDYSDSGMGILHLLGKRQLTLTSVQASFLRANFLKYVGKVTESWHAIGSAIRDAQEIGMHRDSLDPQPASDDVGDVLENMWLVQRRRRLYMVLSMWDLHCGLVLGRPGAIDRRLPLPTLPIDAPIPKDRRSTPLAIRDEERDPPTPITKQIAAFKLMEPLARVVDLERDGPCPKDYRKVDEVHAQAETLFNQIPPYMRQENPDTRWDDYPDCHWIPATRYYLPQASYFNFVALHRPYAFQRKESRAIALRASIDNLQSQMEAFQGMDPKSWRNFLLFFGSFDAVVIMASVYIFFPHENVELAPKAMQQFQWTMERFEAMSERNKLAKAAKGVLQAVYAKFSKVLNGQVLPRGSTALSTTETSASTAESVRSAGESCDTGPTSVGTPHERASNGTSSPTSTRRADSVSNYPPPPQPQAQLPVQVDWSIPANFDFSSMPPLFPISDIIYHDVGIQEDPVGGWGQHAGQAGQPGPDVFEGDFGGDSFWSLMNQYELPR